MLLRVAGEKGAVTGCRSRMTHLRHAAICTDDEAESVRDLAPRGQSSLLLKIANESDAADAWTNEVLVPLEQIAHGREKPAVAVDVLERHLQSPAALPAAPVGRSAILHDS